MALHELQYKKEGFLWERPGPFSAFNPQESDQREEYKRHLINKQNVKEQAFLRNPDEGLEIILSNVRK
jgi:hypothetical protein